MTLDGMKPEPKRGGQKTVAISEDYLVFLHDQLAVNQAKLKELLDAGAQTIDVLSADSLTKTIGRGPGVHPIDGVVEKIRGWGMDVSIERKGVVVEVGLKCPYAEVVHPKMSAKEPVCPLNEYVLGAVRMEDRGALLEHNVLTKDGARFVIKTG
jgi:hypothetical protein